jgi:hypothetical protein
MDGEALNDYPLGKYDVTVTIHEFAQDRLIAWAASSTGPCGADIPAADRPTRHNTSTSS